MRYSALTLRFKIDCVHPWDKRNGYCGVSPRKDISAANFKNSFLSTFSKITAVMRVRKFLAFGTKPYLSGNRSTSLKFSVTSALSSKRREQNFDLFLHKLKAQLCKLLTGNIWNKKRRNIKNLWSPKKESLCKHSAVKHTHTHTHNLLTLEKQSPDISLHTHPVPADTGFSRHTLYFWTCCLSDKSFPLQMDPSFFAFACLRQFTSISLWMCWKLNSREIKNLEIFIRTEPYRQPTLRKNI